MLLKEICLIAGFSILLACNAATNPLGQSVPEVDKLAFDQNLSAARAYYDSGDLPKAQQHGEIAVLLNGQSEQAAVLLAYIYLGRIGIGPFQVAKGLLTNSTSPGAELLESAAGPNATLDKLSTMIGFTEEDFAAMGTIDSTVPELPLLIPNCAEEARRDVEKLTWISRAISLACPFVSPSARIPGELRHLCTSPESEITLSSKANFLWAFAHLAEALAFHSVLTYTTTQGGDKSNLEMRFAALSEAKAETPSEVVQLVKEVETLEAAVSKIMPISGSCSPTYAQTQLNALVNDMVSVSAAFAAMPGLPKSISSSVTAAMDQVNKGQAEVGEATADSSRLKAMKGDFSKNLGSVLADKINSVNAADAQQVADLCAAYGSITGEQSDDASKPAICP